MKAWDGRLPDVEGGHANAATTEAEGRKGSSSPPLLLTGVDFSPSQLEYLERVACPLLTSMLQDAAHALPAHLPKFLTRWLLRSQKIPPSLSDPVLSWLKIRKDELPEAGSEGDTPRCSLNGECSSPSSNVAVFKVRRQSQVACTQTDPTLREINGDDNDRAHSVAATTITRQISKEISTIERLSLEHKDCLSLSKESVKEEEEEEHEGCRQITEQDSDDDAEGEDVVEDMDIVSTGSLKSNIPSQLVAHPPPGRSSLPRRPSALKNSHDPRHSSAPKGSVRVSLLKPEGSRRDSLKAHKAKLARRGRAVSIFRPPPAVSMPEKLALLKHVPILKKLADVDLETLAAEAQVRTFDPDNEIVRHGDMHQELHMIYSGQVRVCVPTLQGTLGAGDFFGETGLTKPHLKGTGTFSAIGAENSQVVTIALSQEACKNVGLLSSVQARRCGLSTVVRRTGTTHCGRRPTPAEIVNVEGLKTPQDRELIMKAIKANSHFTGWLSLSEKQCSMMVDMMQKTTAKEGENIVTVGEKGNSFYVVNDGFLEVHAGEKQMHHVSSLRIGDSFGELALLYNSARKATVKAIRRCELWVLVREQFQMVMREKSDERISDYKQLINTVPMLAEELTALEKATLADAMEECFFVKDEEIVTQGEEGGTFYIIFDGTCEVRVNGQPQGLLQKGHFFGERAVLTKEPRQATVVCVSATATLLKLDSISFALILSDAFAALKEKQMSSPEGGAKLELPGGPSTKVRKSILSSSDMQSKLIDRVMLETGGERQCRLQDIKQEELETIGGLGCGAFGVVTLVKHKQTEHIYALKAMSKGHIKLENLKTHVLSEKKTMEMLDSMFCVRLYQTYRDAQYVYFLLEVALGGELYDLYHTQPGLWGSEAHAKFYGVCALMGLDHLHKQHIIYRDLKLENVLLYQDGYGVLTDMGLAKVVIGKTYTICGTADYFAPETLRQVGHTRAVDWWAWGVFLFIMMAGRSPFDAENVMQVYQNIVKGFRHDLFPESFSPDLVDLIRSVCKKKPEQRLPMAPGGCSNIEHHPWFQGLAFDSVLKRQFQPPYQPPEVDFEVFKARLEKSTFGHADFVENDILSDCGWDDEFDRSKCVS